MATIQEVYIALFGRPADPIGYNFYVEATNDGANLDAVGALSNSPEYLNRFEGQNDVQSINSIFQDLFGRDADAQGLLFYVALLQSGEATIQDIAIRILDGATGTDAAIIDAKVAAAQLFTDSLDTGSEIIAYQGDSGIAFGQQFLDQIQTGDDVLTQEEIDAQIAEFVTEGPNVPGNVFTLTPATNVQTGGVDIVEGTSNNDTIRAIAANSLDSSDIIDGGAGQDVLNITGAVAGNAAPVISNVETINNAGGGFDLGSVTGADRINSSVNSNYTNAQLGTTFGATATGLTVGVAYAGSTAGEGTTVNFATDIDNVAGTATFLVGADAAAAVGIENVTLDVSGDANDVTTVNLDGDLVDLETITITGDGDVRLQDAGDTDLGSVDLETINASAATGNVTIVLEGFTAAVPPVVGPPAVPGVPAVGGANSAAGAADLTVTLGSGNDSLTLNGQEDATVTLGAGNDALNLAGTEQGLTATLGLGTDSVVITSLSNIADADEADFASDIISITDFNGSQDFLNLTGTTLQALNNVEQGSIGSTVGDDLFDAVGDAAAFTNVAGESVVFEFGGSTYVYVAADGDGLFEVGDGLVELVGFTGDFTAANFAA